jgi:hypothetical protein
MAFFLTVSTLPFQGSLSASQQGLLEVGEDAAHTQP